MPKSEHGSFKDGLFVPNGGGWEFKPTGKETQRSSSRLTEGQTKLYEKVGRRESTHPLASVIDRSLTAIVSEEMGVDYVSPDPRRRAAQRLLITAVVSGDRNFDTDRAQFEEVSQDAHSFVGSYFDAPLLTGDPATAAQALEAYREVIKDPDLYTPDAQALLASSTDTLLSSALDAARGDSLELDARKAQQVKETTNGLYAQLLFDTLYAPYVGQKGYGAARERFVATRLALQTLDDAVDIGEDMDYGNANLFVLMLESQEN